MATGKIKGYHQYDPNESWDWDEVSPPILVDFQRNGKTVKGLIDVARDGYLWFLERTDGAINFVDGTPLREAERLLRASTPRPAAPKSIPTANRAPARPRLFVRRCGAARTGRPIAFSPADPDDLHSGE